MQINAIGTDYSAGIAAKSINSTAALNNRISHRGSPTGYSALAFKGGNEKHLFHQISEMTLLGQAGGGVGTVGNDLFFFPLSHNDIKDFDKVIENIPLYNQEVVYAQDIDKDGKIIGVKQDGVKLRRIPTGLPENHPFKPYEGEVFTTALKIDKTTDLVDLLAKPDNYNKVFIVDEVGSKTMHWGLEKEVPIGIYTLRKDDKVKNFLRSKSWSEEQIQKIDVTLTYVDSTASMAKPYADGSYATATGDAAARKLSCNWQGKPYAKEAKATAELLPFLKEKYGFDPKFITCHDGQAMPLIQFIAEKNASGVDYYRDKILTAYGHNLNDGYMYELGTKDALIALAKPGEIEKIVNSRQYKQAILDGKEDEFLKSLLPKEIFDGRKQINAVMFPIAYGEKGYVPMFTTVSYDYYKEIINNELLSPALCDRLKGLSDKHVFSGILNVLMDPNSTGLNTKGLPKYYQQDYKVKLTNGTEVDIPKFIAIDEDKKYDLDHVRKVKQHNKISLLKRLDKSLVGSQLWGEGADKTMQWLEKGTGASAVANGNIDKPFKLLGGIDREYLKKLEAGKDVPLFVFWGRGDWQKGAETGVQAWMKYVEKTGDKDSIYVFGGPLENVKPAIELMEKIEKGEDPKLAKFKGRIACQLGWAPGSSYAAAADYATFASRFAPCELTDLESMKKGCIPIVPRVQGMNQKVFDPSDTTEKAQYVNGYKGNYQYYMTEEAALKAANQEEKEKFEAVVKKLKEGYNKEYKPKIGTDIPEELANRYLKEDQNYIDALQRLRDSVIEDDMAKSIERAINDRNSDIAKKILKNHMDLKTTWEENGWANPNGKSTAELVREMHYNPAYGNKNLKKGEELRLDLSKLTSSKGNGNSIGNKIRGFMHSKSGKWAAGIAGGAALISGIGYLGYKSGWLDPKFADCKKHGHLSQIV